MKNTVKAIIAMAGLYILFSKAGKKTQQPTQEVANTPPIKPDITPLPNSSEF